MSKRTKSNVMPDCAAVLVGGIGALVAAEAQASDIVNLSAEYTAEIMGPVAGADSSRGTALDNLDVTLDVDASAIGLPSGSRFFLYVLSNAGGQPNAYIGSLEGVSNIEVGRPRVRLFEAYYAQPLGETASMKLGLVDLNADFYATDSAGLFLAPPFGIGSELAATGSNGPSIFPSTALAATFDFAVGNTHYLRAGVFGANARTLGDPDGIDTEFDDGALLITELGHRSETTHLALGAWTYTDRVAPIRQVTPDDPNKRAFGAYGLAEMTLSDSKSEGTLKGFLRLGVSDGDTGVFNGSGQVGLVKTQVFASRPDSQWGLGLRFGSLSDGFKANALDDGDELDQAEWALEFTYADQITPRVRVQPNIQMIANPGAFRESDTVWVAGVRLSVGLFGD